MTEFPNATVAEYGTYSNDINATMAEIFARGPIHASINRPTDQTTNIQRHGGGFAVGQLDDLWNWLRVLRDANKKTPHGF